MIIDRENYESILVDYLDGKLSPDQKAEVMLFLLKNPDIASEFEGIQEITLNTEKTSFPVKNQLKKTNASLYGIENEIDYLCIAEQEGDITKDEEIKLNELAINDESVRNVRDIFSHTKFQVPHQVVYQHKLQLKRLQVISIRRTTYRIVVGMAASVAVMLAVYTALNQFYPEQIALNVSNQHAVEQTTKPVMQSEKTEVSKETSSTYSNVIATKMEVKESVQKIKVNEVKKVEEEKVSIRTIQSIPARVGRLASITPTKIDLPVGKVNSDIQQLPVNQPYQGSGTKEYTISDLAQIGLKRFANSIGIEYDVKTELNGKKKLSVESKMLAFSTTIGKNGE